MAQFPIQYALPIPAIHITTFSLNSSISSSLIMNATPASTIFPTANLAIFVPFRISSPYVFSKIFCMNGAAVSGNIDLGVYSADGTKIISTGTTVQAGTNAIQSVTVASTEIGPGLFYLAVSMDNTTGTLFAQINVWTAIFLKFTGMAQMATAFALPATATFATVSNVYVPLIGITGRSFV